jgi:hypothetical protein
VVVQHPAKAGLDARTHHRTVQFSKSLGIADFFSVSGRLLYRAYFRMQLAVSPFFEVFSGASRPSARSGEELIKYVGFLPLQAGDERNSCRTVPAPCRPQGKTD